MKSTLKNFALVICLFLVATSCKKEDATPTVKYMAMLSAASEVPTNVSKATGMVDAVYTPSTKVLAYTITFSGITPTAAHIHKAAVGSNGDVILNFGSTITNNMTGTFTLTAEQEADLIAGLYYVNMHSATVASGEIRGQLIK